MSFNDRNPRARRPAPDDRVEELIRLVRLLVQVNLASLAVVVFLLYRSFLSSGSGHAPSPPQRTLSPSEQSKKADDEMRKAFEINQRQQQ